MRSYKTVLCMALAVAIVTVVGTRAVAQDIRSQIVASSVLEVIKKRGALRVGLTSFVPWSMRDKKGELIGFEIDVSKRLAKEMGMEVEFVPTDFAGLIPALLSGKFDTIITGMAITPKRNLSVNFTIPYQAYGASLAVSKTLAGHWKTMEDVNKPDVTIVSRRGSTAVQDLERMFPKAKKLYYDDDAHAFQDVLTGKAHAVFSTEPKPTFWALQFSDKLVVPPALRLINLNLGGFAVRKGDVDILNFLNNWITLRERSGWLKERQDYWFKSTGWWGDVEKNPFLIKN